MSDYLAAMQVLRLAVEDFLLANGVKKIKRRNSSIAIDPHDTWARLTFLHTQSNSTEMGRLRIRDRGILVIDLMWPLGSGTGEVDAVALSVRDRFSEYVYNSLELGVGSLPKDVPTTTDFFHVAVHIPFRHK